jgi:hypothetical protein
MTPRLRLWLGATALAAIGCGPTPLDVVVLPPGSSTLHRGLVAHWSFDEGAGLVAHDDSGSGYHGHLVGAEWTTGRFGGGLAFSGGQYVAVNGFEDPSNAWTVSAWARFGASDLTAPWGSIVSTEVPGQGGWMVYLEGQVAAPRLNFEYAPPGSPFLEGTGCCENLQADAWYHVTAVADPSAASLLVYEGSQPRAVAPLSATLPPGDPTLFMGSWRFGNDDPRLGGFLSGTIDDVSIYSRALSQTEIAALDAAPVP